MQPRASCGPIIMPALTAGKNVSFNPTHNDADTVDQARSLCCVDGHWYSVAHLAFRAHSHYPTKP